MTPMEEALDALTDAMHYHQRRCAKDQPHDHALLRKLHAAIKRIESSQLAPSPDQHVGCFVGRPCSTGCTAGRR